MLSDNIRTLWDYLNLTHPLRQADAIIGFGSYDTATAERGARLWLDGWAPVLLFTGGLGKGTEGFFQQPEADTYAAIARDMGVAPRQLLVENRATNSGENITLSRACLREAGIDARRIIAVHKPYMGRRVYAALRRQWPEVEVIVAPHAVTYAAHRDAFARQGGEEAEIINSMVGDLQRMALFAAQGFQIPQDIPPTVWAAYDALVAAGYTKYVVAPSG